MGVTEGVPLGVVDADVVSLSSLKFPLGILNFCTARKTKTVKKKKVISSHLLHCQCKFIKQF